LRSWQRRLVIRVPAAARLAILGCLLLSVPDIEARLAIGCLLFMPSASGCSLFLRPGLRVRAIHAVAISDIVQLKLSFSESTYSYGGDEAPCGSEAVLQYNWACPAS